MNGERKKEIETYRDRENCEERQMESEMERQTDR